MRELLVVLGGALAGYLTVTKVAPYIQAKVEARDLDAAWSVWQTEGWM